MTRKEYAETAARYLIEVSGLSINAVGEVIRAHELVQKNDERGYEILLNGLTGAKAFIEEIIEGLNFKKMGSNKWKPIPRDKDGFFDDESNLYDELPIILAEEDEEYPDYPNLFYVDKENWLDWISDFNKQRYKYYLPCQQFPTEGEI